MLGKSKGIVIVPIFSYIAYDQNGKQIKDTITAVSKDQALSDLAYADLMVESISPSLSSISLASRGLSSKQIFAINKQFISLLKAGITLTESISILANHEKGPGSKGYFSSILEHLKQGRSFADAAAQFPETFDDVYISLVRTGESSGDIIGAIKQYQNYLSMRLELSRTIKQALAYPIFLLFAVFIVLGVLLVYVVPNFSDLFKSFGADLPFMTQLIVNTSKMAPYLFASVFSITVLAMLLRRSIQLTDPVLSKIDKILRRVPVVGQVRTEIQVARMMRILASLLASGSPMSIALRCTKDVFSKVFLGAEIEGIMRNVESGGSLSLSINNLSCMPTYAKEMISVGEKSSELPGMMTEVAEYCEEEIQTKLKYISTLIEPMLMLVLGLLVGGIIISMYLPIFYLADVVK